MTGPVSDVCATTYLDATHNLGLEAWSQHVRPCANDSSRRWTRVYADELRGAPLSPAFYSLTPFHGFPQAFFELHGEVPHDLSDRFRYVHASGYADVQLVQRMYEYQPRMFRRGSVLHLFPLDLRSQVVDAPFRWIGRLRRTLVMEVSDGRQRSLRRVADRINELVPEFERQMAELTRTPIGELGDDELCDHTAELAAIAGWFGKPCGDAVMFHANDLRLALIALLDRWVGDGERRYAAVSTGLPASRTVRETKDLYRLARRIAAIPNAREELRRDEGTWDVVLRAVRAHDDTGLATELEQFRAAHAHRGAHYKDVIYPRWGDHPDLLLSALRGANSDEGGSPGGQHQRAGEARVAAQAEILAELRGPRAIAKRRTLQWLFRWNDIYALVRDDHRFHFDRVWAEHRRILLEWGRRLTARGLLQDEHDVFFLGRSEVETAWRSATAPPPETIDARRQAFEHARRCSGPRYLRGSHPEVDETDTPGASLAGVPASPGRVAGRARIVLDIAELDRVLRDDIVVTRQTDPSWSPVFPRIGGLVLETGGVLAHGASLCREYALPCVTAVARASERIPDGSRIEIDGTRGTVRVLEPCAPASEPQPPSEEPNHADSR